MHWPITLFVITVLLVVGYLILLPRLKQKRRARIYAQPFPQPWRALLLEKMPLYQYLPDELRSQLHGNIHVFMLEKHFRGCGGLELTLEMKLLISAQACILLLNRPHDFYDKLKHILVYPSLFIVEHDEHDAAGVVHSGYRTLSGESWQHGRIIVSWENVLTGAANPKDGDNVVFHEFAHQLDGEFGQVNGAPLLGERDAYAIWAQAMGSAYQHRTAITGTEFEHGSVLSRYATTNPAEFFAVATEAFFERPVALAAEYPHVYSSLAKYYAVDPKEWILHAHD